METDSCIYCDEEIFKHPGDDTWFNEKRDPDYSCPESTDSMHHPLIRTYMG